MKQIAYALILYIFICLSGCYATPPVKTKKIDREITKTETAFLNTDYNLITNAESIPVGIRNLVTPQPHPIANPEEEFNATDAINPNYPMYRLVFSGISVSTQFILYEQGGIAYSVILIVANIKNEKVESYCRFGIKGLPNNINVLKSLFPNEVYSSWGYKCL